MFKINDTVVYAAAGVCVISDIKEISLRGAARNYYVLSPLNSPESKIFVPTDNERLTAKIKRVMSEKEIASLLGDTTDYAPWIEDRVEREREYSQIISRGDKKEILSILRHLYGEKVRSEADGKKQYVSDKRIMSLAEKIIGDELSYVMKLPKGSVARFICEGEPRRCEAATASCNFIN